MFAVVLLFRILWFTLRVVCKSILLLLSVLHTLRRWGGPAPNGALGTARFATRWEMFLAGVRRGHGPIVGRVGRSFLRFNKDGMIVVFAPMGAGKGVGIVVPNLLSYPASIVCTDIKGENHAITARQRRKFGAVRILSTKSPALSDSFNPLDMVRVGSWDEKDDAEALARLMVIPGGSESHWDSKAEGLLTCLILHTLRLEPERRTLSQVRTFATLQPESLQELLREIATRGTSQASELAGSFIAMNGSEEFRSILSNAEKATRVWSAGTPAGEISRRSTFALSELVEETTTLFLVVDEEKLDTYSGFLRVMVGSVINSLTRTRKHTRHKNKVLLLLDEAAALGNLEPLERGVGYLRAYCTPVLVFQDMTQLRELYRRAGSFLANATCKVFFNIADLEAARFVSEMIGQTTAHSRSHGVSHSNLEMLRQNLSLGISEASRWLLDPSEVMRLPGSRSLVLFRSDVLRYPVLASKINYRSLRHWYWWGKYDRWRPSAEPVESAP